MIADLPAASATSPSLVRRINAGLVLRTLRTRTSMSRPEISAATGLSQPTVNDIAAKLLRDRLAVEAGPRADPPTGRRGPKAARLAFNASAGHVLGIDIGAAQIVVLVADLSGRIVARTRLETGARCTLRPDPLLARLEEAVSTTLAQAKLTRRDLSAVGVGVPAIVDPVSGRVSLVPALPDWEGLALVPRLQPHFDCPILVNTDVHLACLAESRLGAAREDANAVYIHLGVGIGMGVLIGGRLLPGFDGAAGQIGNLPILDDEDPPEAGFGQFEWTAGSSAFPRLGRRAVEQACGSSLIAQFAGGDLEAIGPATIAAAAAAGDVAARRIMARQIEHLAQGLAAVTCVLNPATIILGGEIAAIGAALVGPLRARLAALVPRPPRHLIASFLGTESVALGAMQVALQEAEERLMAPLPAKVA
ncbi:MAG: ROK family protein [Alphaproteobacteria bacterium]|nr:ROK family protein [Alphaproteobacteria bacterium]